MPFLDETGLQTLWSNTKSWFAKYLNSTADASKVTIELKSGQKLESDSEVLDSVDITAATESSAGVMSAADKTKLNGVATGATANVGTITSITTTSPLAGSGTSGSVALSHASSGVTSGTYGTTATTSLTPTFGGTFDVPGVTVNSTGHVTTAGSHTVKIPNAAATQSSAGLMSATDKTKLDGLTTPPSPYDSTPSAVSTAGSKGKSASYSRGDHTHSIALATGDSNGQIKIAGTNVAVKGLGSAAYTASTAYATAAQGTLAANAIPSSQKGANSGVAELDENGKVPASQLPSYVDDVLEYTSQSSFPSTGETGKIYVDTTTNLTYRWGGTAYVKISPSIALGETSSTAYRGDRGAKAYTHATSDTGVALTSGLYKITTSSRGHVIAGTAVSSGDIVDLGIDASLIPMPDTGFASTVEEAIYQILNAIDDLSNIGATCLAKAITAYGTSSTAAASAAKVVECSGYELHTGNMLAVLFSTANSATALSLNVNGTGSKKVVYRNAVISTTNPLTWEANTLIHFVYDGSQYRFISSDGAITNTQIAAICV